MKVRTNNYYGIRSIRDTSCEYEEGDCCFGCPYKCCPCRPSNTRKTERPNNCIWSFYLGIMNKGDM